jgi:hypothetical protein
MCYTPRVLKRRHKHAASAAAIFLFLFAVLLIPIPAPAAIINVTTNDNYTKIEGAKAGDTVLIAPGTYSFRVYLTGQGQVTNPIVIQALDPANRPVWDFGTTLVENAPGSYTAGDRGRGGWQFSGAQNYSISGIIFRHARTSSFNSAGIRYYNTTTNLYIKNCLFEFNDDGLTGGTQNSQATVEFCEFNSNGNLGASSGSPTHNLYIYGGYLTLRYCYVHDAIQAQDFHIRCRDSTIEYNWFARATNYEGDLMSDDDFFGAGPGPWTQSMVFRGNVLIQNTLPGNHSQIIAMYNDESITNLTLNLRAIYNTFIGANTNGAFVHVSNADGTQMKAEISDNIIYGTKTAVLIENTNAATVTGLNNWMQTNAAAGPLTNSVRTASPGFRSLAAKDYTLTNGSPCIGAANSSVYGLPGREYYQNETNSHQWRVRAGAHDLGAFESTSTASPVGPNDPAPRPKLTIQKSSPNAQISWPLFAQDFQLFQSPLTAPFTWRFSTAALSTNADGVAVSVPASAGNNIFRLQK